MARSTSDGRSSRPRRAEEGVEDAAVGEVDRELLDAEGLHALPHQEQDLQVRRGRVGADHVEVHLHELAVAAALRVLPAPDLCRVPAAEGQGQLGEVRRHEPREGHGEVEAHGHVAAAVVGEAVDLLVGLPAALAQEHLGELEHGRVDGGKAEQAKYRLQLPQ